MTTLIHFFWLSWMVFKPFLWLRFWIHLIPCSWGSIIRGQRVHWVTKAPFSREIRSLAKPSFFQKAKSESLAKTNSGSRPSLKRTPLLVRSGNQVSAQSSRRKAWLNAPMYDTNEEAIMTSPTKSFFFSSKPWTVLLQRLPSSSKPRTRRLAKLNLSSHIFFSASTAALASVAFFNSANNSFNWSSRPFTLARTSRREAWAVSYSSVAAASAAWSGATCW